MAQQPNLSVQNNFIAGLKTQYTGLNYPENATIDSQNVVYTLTGDVVRRSGMDYEQNFVQDFVDRTGLAMSTYKWNNVGGDGQTQIVVRQIGTKLYFFLSSSATVTHPLSNQELSVTIDITGFQASGNVNSPGITECTYSDGNGYLFVYHKDCDPFYCYFVPASGGNPPTVVGNRINLQIRDFFGIYPEPGNPSVTLRPSADSGEHFYNLLNQGWTSGALWSTGSNQSPLYANLSFGGINVTVNLGSTTFTVGANVAGITVGQAVVMGYSGSLQYQNGCAFYTSGYTITGVQGIVTAYTPATGVITINITVGGQFTQVASDHGIVGLFSESVSVSVNAGINTISTWNTKIGNFPSNADIWWRFKNTSGVFDPATTINNVTLPTSQAPSGHFIYNAFNQDRTSASGATRATFVASITSGVMTVTGTPTNGEQLGVGSSFNTNAGPTTITALGTGTGGMGTYTVSPNQTQGSTTFTLRMTPIITSLRPTNGSFFAGRVWYTGVNASQTAGNELTYYTWTENIYFSQIIQTINDFGQCFQDNDPTDENFFDILPSDGGVITIQGTGAIYKLFPVQNGMLVFAANGIWFITGSTGIGFSATDYTITKISGIQSISSTSYINVLGYPMFWNEEGVYYVSPGNNGVLEVEPLVLDTILSFYNAIPLQSKKFAKGDYNPINYQVQWVFRSTNESTVTDRYQYDRILVFNVKNKAFYYYTLPTGSVPYVHDIRYVAGPGGSTSPAPTFKYLSSYIGAGPPYNFQWSEERDSTNLKDWNSAIPAVNYVSYFVAGYNLHGKAYAKWQPVYVYLFFRNTTNNSYKIQGQWDFAIAGGKMSTVQTVNDITSPTNFSMFYKRHKVRGHGLAFQLRIQSVDGKPFDLMGWSMFEMINQGV